MVADRGLEREFLISSSATSTEEIWNGVGNPVYPPAKRELAAHGISCEGKRAVQLQKSDYEKYDLFVGMDSANIRNMHRILGGDPDGKIRKLMDYYLPTTLKLLNAYDRMSVAGIGGENIDTTKARVENMMTTIVESFKKQYDSLFGADALDISTEISVLETMMVREGFTGERMEAETTKNADGTDIKLEL